MFCAAALALLALPVHAQTPPPAPQTATAAPKQTPPVRARPRASVTRIVVRNQSGTPISEALVTITGPVNRGALTDSNGVISVPSLTDGKYRIRFEHEGFVTFEREVVIRAGQPAEIAVALDAAPTPKKAAPPPEPERPLPPAPPSPPAPTGSPVTLSIPFFLDKNFIGRDPLKESVLGCTAGGTTRLLQLRDPVAPHTHPDLDEVLYVVAGEGAIRVNDTSTAVSAGSLSIIPRGLSHGMERRGRNPLILLSTLSGAPCSAPSPTQASKR